MAIDVLIVDADAPARDDLARRLARVAGCRIAGTAGDAAEALALLRDGDAHVVLLNVQRGTGRETADCAAVAAGTSVPIVVLVSYMTAGRWATMRRAGATDFVLKRIDTDGLGRELEAIVSRRRSEGG